MGHREQILYFPLLLFMTFAFVLLNCLPLEPWGLFQLIPLPPLVLLRRGVMGWLGGVLACSQGQPTTSVLRNAELSVRDKIPY